MDGVQAVIFGHPRHYYYIIIIITVIDFVYLIVGGYLLVNFVLWRWGRISGRDAVVVVDFFFKTTLLLGEGFMVDCIRRRVG